MSIRRDIKDIFRAFIAEWYNGFKEIAQNILKSGRKLYIIAISRKMPRFFSWLTRHEAEYGIVGLREILDSAEYTTEHALPFLFTEDTTDDYEVVVVDDSMVLGNTVRRVSKDVVAFTSGKKPIVSILVSSDNGYIDMGYIKNLHCPNKTRDEIVAQWLDFVSRCNAKSELPVDVEFPIIHISGTSIESYRNQIEKTIPASDWYELKGDALSTSINVLLDEEIVELTSLDFAKSRCFFYKEDVKLSVFSPFAILQSSIFGGYIFRDPNMNWIWELINRSVRLRSEKRTYQSMVVVINYLNAINTLKRNKELILPQDANDWKIRVSDLQLIIGKKLAIQIISQLSALLSDNHKQSFLVTHTGLPDMYVPKELETSYILQRKFLAAERRGDHNIGLLISNIFNQARYDHSIMGHNTSIFHRMHSAFFESYDSIRHLIEFYFTIENIYLEINKHIDYLIDNGRIIPQYVQVLNSERQTYWRRYFTSAHSSVEL